MKKFVPGFILPFFILLLNGYNPVQARAHWQGLPCPTAKCFHASTASFTDDESASEFQIDKPVPSPRHQEVIELSDVTEVEEESDEESGSCKKVSSSNSQFQADSFRVQTLTYFFRSPKKSLSFFKHFTCLSSRRHLVLQVIRI